MRIGTGAPVSGALVVATVKDIIAGKVAPASGTPVVAREKDILRHL